MTYTEDEVRKLLKLVVDPSNKITFAEYIERMINCLSTIKRKYWGTSIILVKGKDESSIRWIDFHYYSKFLFNDRK
jgi:hypothetical protein